MKYAAILLSVLLSGCAGVMPWIQANAAAIAASTVRPLQRFQRLLVTVPVAQ